MPTFVAAAIVFGTSAAVLVLEIMAGRLLAPYVGVTLETWTGIIGTVLAGIALGTWLGGRLADAVDPRRLPGPLLIAGGALTLLVVPLVGVAAGMRIRPDPAGIVLFATICCFVPAAVLSAINPTVVKIQLRDLGETGSVVGRLSALGTAGAIAGTFLTGFVLVSAMPSRPIVLITGTVLILAGVAVAVVYGRMWRLATVATACLALVIGTGWTLAAPEPCERESAYFCVRVEPDPGHETGRTLYLDTVRHAYVDVADPTRLEFSYTRIIGDVIDAMAPAGVPLDALHLGGGGFTMPRYLEATRPGSRSLVLELDPVVLATAREELGLVPSERLIVRTGDARLGILEMPPGRFDLVIGDAFGGLAVPWHLTTQEFLEQVRRTMRPDGIYIANVIDYPPLRFARAELATLRAVFRHVAVMGPQARVAGNQGGNVMLVASDAPLPAEAIIAADRARDGANVMEADPARVAEFVDGAPVLTDDFAPVDQLMSRR